MKLSQTLKIIPSILFLAYSAYILIEVALQSTQNWRFYLALIGLIFYLGIFLLIIWGLFFKRKTDYQEKPVKKISSVAFGLLMGTGLGLFLYARMELKFILLIAPLLGLFYGLILKKIENLPSSR
jgi:hypothetical protein